MYTLDQLVYNILNIYRGGRSTNNEHASTRQIKEWIHYYRALYIRRDEERNRRLREFEQAATFAIQTVETRDDNWPRLAKTTLKLPKLIRFKDNEGLTYVGNQRQLEGIQVVDDHSAYWRQFNKYTPNNARTFKNPTAFVRQDGHLYLRGIDDDLDEVLVRGIYENPEEFYNFLIDNNLNGATENDDWEYPLPRDMAESIVKQIVESEMRLLTTSPLDIRHNNLPDHQLGTPQPE